MPNDAPAPAALDRGGRLRSIFDATLKLARFLVADQLGVFCLLWAAAAFIARPAVIDAVTGGSGGLAEALRGRLDLLSLARLSAMLQWISFAGVLAIPALIHVRIAQTGKAALSQHRSRLVIGAAYAALTFLGYVAFLWAPISVFTLITHDSLIFYDATYRIQSGLRPSVDFPTVLGAACLYLPAFAKWLTGSYAGSVELASAMVALALGLACAQAGATRFPILVTVILSLIVFLVATPAAMLQQWGGESQTVIDGVSQHLTDNLTYAMFYNRWGWAALIPVFAWLAPRNDDTAPRISEIDAFGAVLTFLFYLKLTYFAVGVGGAALYAAFNPRPFRTLLIGVGVAAGLILLAGFAIGNLFAYLHDLIETARVSGGRSGELVTVVRENALDILLSVASLAVIGATGKLTRRDLLTAGFIIVGSIFVINQNGETRNLPSLIGLAAYGVARTANAGDRMIRFASLGAFLMLAASPLIDRGMLLIDQVYAERREQTRPPSLWADIPALKGVYVPERESFLSRADETMTPEQRRKDVWLSGMYGRREMLRQGEYMQTLLAGVADLRSVAKPGESVATLDMTNPFPFLMGLRAPRGAWLTMHKDRTISEAIHPAPEVLFADADHVMIAKMSMVQNTATLAHNLYGPWLAEHYQDVVETDYWRRYSHRKDRLRARSASERSETQARRQG